MTAIINQPNQEEVIYDLNTQLFNVLPKPLARVYWRELDEMIQDGLDEATAYTYVNRWIKEHNDDE